MLSRALGGPAPACLGDTHFPLWISWGSGLSCPRAGYGVIAHPLLARNPSASWYGEVGNILPSSCSILEAHLIWVACMSGGWGCRVDGDKEHVSALSSLTCRACCHFFMFQMFMKEMFEWKCSLQCTWHWKYLLQEIPPCVYKWASPKMNSHKYLENVTINLELSQDVNLGWPACVVPCNPSLPHKAGWMVWETHGSLGKS